MTDHPRLLEALRLVESGAVRCVKRPGPIKPTLCGAGVMGRLIWSMRTARPALVLISVDQRGSNYPVTLTEAGKRRLEEAR